jgi:hypothetical protein
MAIRSVLRAAGLGVALFVVGGCASGGNEILRNQDAATVNTLIVDNKTTRDEVLAIYGAPTVSSFLNEKNEMWTYRWARATAQGQNFIPVVGPLVRGYDTRKKELVIVFNEQSIVARHTMLDTINTVKTGLIDPGAPSSPPSGISTPSPKRNAVGGSVPAPAAATPSASAVQVAAVTRLPARAAGTLPERGVWECGLRGSNNHTYKLQFVVDGDRSVVVTNYANALATVVQKDPLTMTATNPRGDRPMNIVWNIDNTIESSGPYSKDPSTTFHDVGSCTKV